MKQLLMLTAILVLIGCSSDNSSMSVPVGPDVSGVDLEEETMSSSSSSSSVSGKGRSSSSVDEFTANCKADYKAINAADSMRLSVPQVFYRMQRIYDKEHTLECVKAMYPLLVDEFYVEREVVYVEQCDMEFECPVEVEVDDESMSLVSTIRCDLVEKNLRRFFNKSYPMSCPNVAMGMESDGFYVEKVGPDTGEVKFYD